MFIDEEKINTKGYFKNQNGCLKENYKFKNMMDGHQKLNLLSILLDLDRLTFLLLF